MTDESRLYEGVGPEFASHGTVNHSGGEYALGDVHTNTLEGFFSVFKRGMRGVYQHCRENACTFILQSSSFATTTVWP
jgi:hypothetical protein